MGLWNNFKELKLKIKKNIFKYLLRIGIRKLVARLPVDETRIADYFVGKILDENEIYEIQGFKLKKGRTTRLPILTGEVEPSQTKLMKKIVKPGMVVFDLGANFGWFTLVLSKLVGSSGRVYSFEVDPHLVSILKKNVELNSLSNVSIEPVAISNKTGTSLFSLNESYDTRNQLESLTKSSKTIETKTVFLDDFCINNGLKKIDLIKMDIEGSELKALHGMKKIIYQNPTLKIIMEFNQNALNSVGDSPESLIDFLINEGFIIEEIDENKNGRIHRINKENLLKKRVCNCYCYKEQTNL